MKNITTDLNNNFINYFNRNKQEIINIINKIELLHPTYIKNYKN